MDDRASDDAPLLEVEDLVVEIPTRHGTLRPVDGVSFTIHRGEILGVVGESGGREVDHGGGDHRAARSSGAQSAAGVSRSRAPGSTRWARTRSGACAARAVGTVFQDPSTSLNPLKTIGDQLAETALAHLDVSRTEGARAGGSARARRRRHPSGRRAPRRLAARVLRRHASARRDRARADRRARARHRRRADDGARRVGAGADPRTPQEALHRARRRRSCSSPTTWG